MKQWNRCVIGAAVLACILQICLGVAAQTVPVRRSEGTLRGFLELRTKENQLIAAGDLFQVVRGDRVSSRLVFQFKDGSIDEETSVFTQRGSFQLVSDHHVQKGPSFPHPMDVLIDVKQGLVTVKSTDSDGKKKTASEKMKLTPDLANGVIFTLLKHIRPDVAETKLPMIVATPKPRLVKLVITPKGEETFSVAGASRKATHYVLKIELGGAAGLVAPLIGKEPPDIHVWICGGEVPAFVKSEGPTYQGGPTWVTQLATPIWPK